MKVNWATVGGLIGKAAPIIGGLVGGPAGGAAGLLVSKVLGCDNTPEAVEQELKANPEAYAKLKAAQLTHKKELAELAYKEKELMVKEGIDHRKIDTEDIQDARGRDTEMKKAGYKNQRADIMIGIAFAALVIIIGMIFKSPTMPAGQLAIFNMTIGYLLKMLGDAFAFEFGSSRGSKEKDGAGLTIQTILAKLGK